MLKFPPLPLIDKIAEHATYRVAAEAVRNGQKLAVWKDGKVQYVDPEVPATLKQDQQEFA